MSKSKKIRMTVSVPDSNIERFQEFSEQIGVQPQDLINVFISSCVSDDMNKVNESIKKVKSIKNEKYSS
jgi:hypothetical protein